MRFRLHPGSSLVQTDSCILFNLSQGLECHASLVYKDVSKPCAPRHPMQTFFFIKLLRSSQFPAGSFWRPWLVFVQPQAQPKILGSQARFRDRTCMFSQVNSSSTILSMRVLSRLAPNASLGG